MKKKLELNDLKVKSFVTNFDTTRKQTVNLKGGGDSVIQVCILPFSEASCDNCNYTNNNCGTPPSVGCTPAPSNGCTPPPPPATIACGVTNAAFGCSTDAMMVCIEPY